MNYLPMFSEDLILQIVSHKQWSNCGSNSGGVVDNVKEMGLQLVGSVPTLVMREHSTTASQFMFTLQNKYHPIHNYALFDPIQK